MELAQFYQLIKKGKLTLVTSVLIFVLLAMAFTFLRPLEFRAQSRLLIIQNSQEGTDPFVAAKANEYLGGVLTKIVASNSFLEEVLASGLNVDKDYFSNDQRERAKTWQKMIAARSYGDLGVIEISVFHADKYQAEQVAQAVDLALKNKSSVFLGTGDKVEIRVIDQPIVSKWPVRPNIVLNMILGPVIGLIFGLFYLYLFAKVSIEPAPIQAVQETQPEKMPIEPAPQQQAVATPCPEPAPVEVQAQSEPARPRPAEPVAQPAAGPSPKPAISDDFDLDDILNQGNISNLL
ncbi:hypothetical protein HGA34_01610 [Candidatus Falkowbacteria bacterium]|nr:hypothetical protein [Candidatus Falkowbacteria bacterium]